MVLRSIPGFVCLILLILVSGTEASAQNRSDTGRHKAKPAPTPEKIDQETGLPYSGPVDKDWTVSASVGLLGSGSAFQVETADGVSIPWDLGGGATFNASRFNATFDQNISFGLELDKGMGRYWGLGIALGYSQMNLGAEALVGQQGTVVLLDRIDVFNVGLGGQAKFLQAPSHPFFSAEVLMTSLGAGIITAMDQTTFGWRLGLGYRQILSPHWAGKVEVRLSRTGFSMDDYIPESPQVDPETIEFESEDHLTFFEIMLSVEFR